MNRKVIVIAGYLAAGKSTFALQLSKALQIPYLIKDTFKIALCSNVKLENQEESSLFSSVTFDGMMYMLERMFEVGQPIIIEGNFAPSGIKKTDEEGVIKKLINTYGYHSFTYRFLGDTQVLYQRFIEREDSSERGQANRMFSNNVFYTGNVYPIRYLIPWRNIIVMNIVGMLAIFLAIWRSYQYLKGRESDYGGTGSF